MTADVQVGKASPDAKWLNVGYLFSSYATYGQFEARPVVEFTLLTCCGDTSFGIRYGGGVRYAYGPQLDFRVRFSLLTGFCDGFVDTGWGIGGGIVWKLGWSGDATTSGSASRFIPSDPFYPRHPRPL